MLPEGDWRHTYTQVTSNATMSLSSVFSPEIPLLAELLAGHPESVRLHWDTKEIQIQTHKSACHTVGASWHKDCAATRYTQMNLKTH